MRKRICIVLALLIAFFATFVSLPSTGKAFGDYNDYSYDSGGYDSGSDYGSYGSDSYGSSHSPGRNAVEFCFIVVFCIIAIILYIKKVKNSSNNNKVGTTGKQAPLTNVYIPNRTLEIENIIKSSDEFFSASDFITYAQNVYMDMQYAWCNKDLSPLRSVMHQNLYEQSDRQIQMKAKQGITQVLERITVNEAYLTCYKRDAEYEYVRVYLNSSMIDYQINDSTQKIVYGDKTTRWTMRYDMTFMRSIGTKTPSSGKVEGGIMCPNCGAPINGSSFGICEYCGSTVTSGKYNWVVSNFTAIKDHFNDEGINA